jgi:hypothetical protein
MSNDSDFLDWVVFEECPVCGGYHEYDLQVLRKPVPGIMLPPEYDDECLHATFQTLFTCPEKGEDFEAVVAVEHRMYERVDEVTSKLREYDI